MDMSIAGRPGALEKNLPKKKKILYKIVLCISIIRGLIARLSDKRLRNYPRDKR